MVLMYWWARQYPVTDTVQVEKNTAVQAYGIPAFQWHLQLVAPESWCTTHAGWTGCCYAHWQVFLWWVSLDTSPSYGTTIWHVVSVIVKIFIMISYRTIVGVHPHGKCGFLGICDTSHTPACGVMRIVPDRSAATCVCVFVCMDGWMYACMWVCVCICACVKLAIHVAEAHHWADATHPPADNTRNTNRTCRCGVYSLALDLPHE